MKTFVDSLQTEGEIFAINTRRMYNIYLNSRGANEKSEERELPFLEFHEKYLFSGGFRWTESNSSELFCLRERKITNGKKIIMLRLYVHYYLYRSMNSDFIFSISLLNPGIESPSLYFARTNPFVRKRK